MCSDSLNNSKQASLDNGNYTSACGSMLNDAMKIY